jgi:hypothetical protein
MKGEVGAGAVDVLVMILSPGIALGLMVAALAVWWGLAIVEWLRGERW